MAPPDPSVGPRVDLLTMATLGSGHASASTSSSVPDESAAVGCGATIWLVPRSPAQSKPRTNVCTAPACPVLVPA
jgi:hypothetical protein